MKKVFTKPSIFEIEPNFWGQTSKKPKIPFILKGISLTIFAILLNFGSAKAQCPANASIHACFNNAPVASGITTTTVDISNVTSNTWSWFGSTGFVWTSIGPGGATTTVNQGMTTVNYYSVANYVNSGATGAITITGLLPSTTYYLRAYTNMNGDPFIYSGEISFTTLAAGPTVTMTTDAATAITAISATSGGTATPTGGLTVVERGIVYNTVTNPTTANTKVISGAGAGAFTANLTGLTSSTTYYVRSYSIDNLGVTRYGPNISFTTLFQVSGVVSPFSLSPNWYFGQGAIYNWPSGSYPAVPPGPTVGYIGTNTSAQVETSTSVSFRNGTIAIYSNTMQAFNGASTVDWMSNIRNFAPGGDATCGGSSNGGGVAFPDPANNATNNAFYMVIGNDLTSGGCAGAGVNQYRFTGTGTTVAYASGPNLLATSANSSEAITAGTDGSGGYWLVTHSQAATNTFYVWHYTASGRTGPVTYTPTTSATIATTTSGGYLKFSPCMNMIAFAGFAGDISVYNFDRTTGTIGAEIATKSVGIGIKVGIEFSPDGTKIYYSGQGTVVNWFLIANPATVGTIAGSNSWSMQMGPDAQIYTSGVAGSTTGVITDPNSASAGYSTIALTAPGTVFRGISNISWLSPQLPTIAATNTLCNSYNFSMLFRNYFNDNVNIKTNSYSWNFGDGSPAGTGSAPSHTYPSGINSYTVTLTFRDSCCNQLWTATTTVNTTCVVAPVNFLSFNGHVEIEGNTLYWATSSEFNNGYFEIMKSDDGVTFYSIGSIPGMNQPSGVSNYSFVDYSQSNSAVSYYYIIQHDFDGNTTNTNIISLRQEQLIPVISPNPSIHSFTVSLPYSKNTVITILDILGKVIEKKSMPENATSLEVGETLAKGAYVISVVTDYDQHFYKVIKE